MFRFCVIPCLVAGLFLAGCSNNGDDPFVAADYPLHPATLQEGALSNGEWAEQITELMRDMSRVVLQTNTDLLDDCIVVAGTPPAAVNMSFNDCLEGTDARDGIVALGAVTGSVGDVAHNIDIGETGELFHVEGTLILTLTGSTAVRETGDLTLSDELSVITASVDFTFPAGRLAEDDPYPDGTMTVDYETLDHAPLHVVVTMDGGDIFDIVANDLSFTFDSDTGELTPA
ncbi:MAG: hypothetical protein ABI743_08650 [bacterium]